MAKKETVDKNGLTIKKRCNRCLQYTRPDRTCKNPQCSKYVPDKNNEE